MIMAIPPRQVRHHHDLVILYMHTMNRAPRSWNTGLPELLWICCAMPHRQDRHDHRALSSDVVVLAPGLPGLSSQIG
jgi:hypothetical protein